MIVKRFIPAAMTSGSFVNKDRNCFPNTTRRSPIASPIPNELNDLFTLIPCQIGGYPFFTQYDPRQEDNNEVLLFQLDSQDHILWGDSGVGNFFISKEDLKNKDFSHVRYNWDCY